MDCSLHRTPHAVRDDDPGGSQPFNLSERSRLLSPVSTPSDARTACRLGVKDQPSDVPCYDTEPLHTLHTPPSTFNGYEYLRVWLVSMFHALRLFRGRRDSSDAAVAHAWDRFITSISQCDVNGECVVTKTQLQELEHKFEKKESMWMQHTSHGRAAKIHLACETELFPCAVGPQGRCLLCRSGNPVMSESVRRGRAVRKPSGELRTLISRYDAQFVTQQSSTTSSIQAEAVGYEVAPVENRQTDRTQPTSRTTSSSQASQDNGDGLTGVSHVATESASGATRTAGAVVAPIGEAPASNQVVEAMRDSILSGIGRLEAQVESLHERIARQSAAVDRRLAALEAVVARIASSVDRLAPQPDDSETETEKEVESEGDEEERPRKRPRLG